MKKVDDDIEDILLYIAAKSDDIVIPDKIKPENIEIILDEVDKSKLSDNIISNNIKLINDGLNNKKHYKKIFTKKFYILSSVAASAACIMIIIGIFELNNNNSKGLKPYTNSNSIDSEVGIPSVSSDDIDESVQLGEADLSIESDSIANDDDISKGEVIDNNVCSKDKKAGDYATDSYLSDRGYTNVEYGEYTYILEDNMKLLVTETSSLQTSSSISNSEVNTSVTNANTSNEIDSSKTSTVGSINVYEDNLIVKGTEYSNQYDIVTIELYDLSTPDKPKHIKTISQTGEYLSYYVYNGYIYLFSRAEAKEDKLADDILCIDGNTIDKADISESKKYGDDSYLVYTIWNIHSGKLLDSKAYASKFDVVVFSESAVHCYIGEENEDINEEVEYYLEINEDGIFKKGIEK